MRSVSLLVVVIFFLIFVQIECRELGDWHRKLHSKYLKNGERIVGGDTVPPFTYPHQAAIYVHWGLSNVNFCGGTLVSGRSVLTSGHCIFGSSLVRITSAVVILGAHNIDEDESTRQTFTTSSFTFAPAYDEETLLENMAIVYLPTEVTFNEYVHALDLPSYSDVSNSFEGYKGTVVGWGYEKDDGEKLASILKSVDVTIISNEECYKYYPQFVVNETICTSGAGKVGACQGDSGGPLIVNGKLIGIISYEEPGGCASGKPVVYTRVTSFLTYIIYHLR